MNTKVNAFSFIDFEACLKFTEEIVELSKKKYIKGESNAYHILGIAYYFNKDNDTAYGYYRKTFALINGSEYYEKQAAALHNVALRFKILEHKKNRNPFRIPVI
ncbi:hypothetical protein H8E88_19975 [candidate division KSB1 bacterium]|nr:hypothetical protein [candidate division KSB1 bacterium]